MRRRPVALALATVLLIASACSAATELGDDTASDGTSATAAPTPETSPESDGVDTSDDTSEDAPTDTPPERSADGSREVPPFVLPSTAPGSDEAYAAMVEELDRFLTPEQRAAGVPWPDLRNPDPIAAYRSAADFQSWMMENNTSPPLAEAYTAPASPERGWDVDMFASWHLFDALSTPSDPPYSMDVRGVVHPAATDITDALLAQVPEGSAAVVYWDSVGRRSMVLPDGSVLEEFDGWSNLGPWVAIMAPTDVGWQVWWDELTTVPPPGLDENRGNPTPPPESRDV